ncbi:MAG: hypothetical protein LBN04_10800 [Oscillospiraceae bacterium]|jgi:hypothetical protein|nr:hypothetical protein [Oscillospiraceae bacterium]
MGDILIDAEVVERFARHAEVANTILLAKKCDTLEELVEKLEHRLTELKPPK